MSIETTEKSQRKCARVVVYGRVHGVGFRHFAQATATRCGLVGWVRNNYDGTVEIWAEGLEDAFDPFLKVLKRGPSSSHVRTIDIQWQSPLGKFHSFNIRS